MLRLKLEFAGSKGSERAELEFVTVPEVCSLRQV
jgi:hypothetical protein